MSDKIRILFVDDDPNILNGLKRSLRTMRAEWDMIFVDSGIEAIKEIRSKAIDVIISDMRMPGMDGIQLLSTVKAEFPNTVRLALSGHTETKMLLESVKAVHQFLSKPCSAETVKATIQRAISLRDLLHNEELNQLINGIDSLPSLPDLYNQIMAVLGRPDSTLDDVGEIISQDVDMTVKILQLVNSSFFGLQNHVGSPQEAVKLLGMDIMKGLILTSGIFKSLEETEIPLTVDIKALWAHSLQVGALAKKIAIELKLHSRDRDYAQLAGMLHEIGQVILAINKPEDYREIAERVKRGDMTICELEKELYNATHADIGAYLIGLWGLPYPIVEAVAFHHRPCRSPVEEPSALTALYLANLLINSPGVAPDKVEKEIDIEYLNRIGLKVDIPLWLSLRDETDDS